MAYYGNGFIWPPENTTYDLVTYQDSVTLSRYEPYGLDTYNSYTVSEFDQPKFIDYYHDDYVCDYDYDYGYRHNSYSFANNEINYFSHNYMEPKLLAYRPIQCDTGYVSYHTHYSISNSKMDPGFNEPEFEEYDPTPYGGGYDIVSTYGKPLPPSDKTCYPHSNPKPIESKSGPNLESQSDTKSKPDPEPMSIIPMAETKSTPDPEPKSTVVPLIEHKPEPDPYPEPDFEQSLVPMPDPLGEREMEENNHPDYGYDYPWPEYDHGNGIGVGYDYRYGNQVVQIPPYEYNPEVVDLCESIFGSWPCLARIRKQEMRSNNNAGISTCPENRNHNPLEDCANYFFGGPITSYNQ